MNVPKIGTKVQEKPAEVATGTVLEIKSIGDSIVALVSWTNIDEEYHEKWFDVNDLTEIEEEAVADTTGGKK